MAEASDRFFNLRGMLVLTFLLMVGAVIGSVILTAQMNQALPEPWRQKSFVMSVVVPALISPPIWCVIACILVRNDRLMRQVERLAWRDTLTGLLNRRAFFDTGRRELCARPNGTDPRPAIVMIDIDHFKTINDANGHAAGDAAIAHIDALIAACGGPSCICARLGGDEFAVLFTGNTAAEVGDRVASLRAKIAATPLTTAGGVSIAVTASFGIAFFCPGEGRSSENTLSDLLARADAALYRAKQYGRNRSVLAA